MSVSGNIVSLTETPRVSASEMYLTALNEPDFQDTKLAQELNDTRLKDRADDRECQ